MTTNSGEGRFSTIRRKIEDRLETLVTDGMTEMPVEQTMKGVERAGSLAVNGSSAIGMLGIGLAGAAAVSGSVPLMIATGATWTAALVTALVANRDPRRVLDVVENSIETAEREAQARIDGIIQKLREINDGKAADLLDVMENRGVSHEAVENLRAMRGAKEPSFGKRMAFG